MDEVNEVGPDNGDEVKGIGKMVGYVGVQVVYAKLMEMRRVE
jgi:hypothetical protein